MGSKKGGGPALSARTGHSAIASRTGRSESNISEAQRRATSRRLPDPPIAEAVSTGRVDASDMPMAMHAVRIAAGQRPSTRSFRSGIAESVLPEGRWCERRLTQVVDEGRPQGYPSSAMKQAVLFDLDGTLLDTLEDLADAVNAALSALGFPVHPVDAYRYFVGDGVETLMRRTLPVRRGRSTRNCSRGPLASSAPSMRTRCYAKTRPYPGVIELLADLERRGVRMAILSNKPDPPWARWCGITSPVVPFRDRPGSPARRTGSPTRFGAAGGRRDGHPAGGFPVRRRHEHRHADGDRPPACSPWARSGVSARRKS